MSLESDLERMQNELLKAQIKALFRDQSKVEEALEKSRTDSERMARDIELGKTVTRALRKQKTAKRKKMHWKTSKRKTREHYLMHVVPKNAHRRAELLREGDSWNILAEYWKKKGIESKVDEAEWREEVAPAVDGKVFFVNRYDRLKSMDLGNMIVRETKTGKVLWDGADYMLRKLGYCL